MENTIPSPEHKKPSLQAVIGAMIFIVLVVIWFVVSQEYTLQTGQEVYLETMPIDPRDPLRWDYVVLRYEIERDEKITDLITTRNLQEGDDIYISLGQSTQWPAYVTSVSATPPTSWIFIAGKIGSWNSIDLWIWKYFVPEWTGREIEKVRSDMEILAVIDKYGIAKIKNLYYKWEEINPDTFVAP